MTRSAIPRALALVGGIGPLAYIGLVTVLGLLWSGYDPIHQTQSELGAVDAPNALVMNVLGFMGLGVVILAFAGAYLAILRGAPWRLLAGVGLLVAGAGMIVVGFFPCDPGCVDVTRTGELHGTFSMPGAIGLPAAGMLSAPAFRQDGRLGSRWQLTSFVIGALALASGPLIATETLPGYEGLVQRLAMWAPLLWMSAVSFRLARLSDPSRAGTAGQTG
jgi:hypothetical protein